jgi:tyrosyl-tRNA synthetase
MQLVAELASRGLVQQTSDPALDSHLAKLLARGPASAYVGFDPTADSLHLGNFLGILALMYAQKHGIRPIAVVGGATGLIGDPSGKTSERQLLTPETVAKNVEGVRAVLARFLDFNHPTAPASIVSNLDWFGPMSAIAFLRDIGKHFRLGPMLAKDSVKSRMEGSDEGMSYTEFSYQLLQGYDFYHLHKHHHCVLQMGGSDQWGNITAGTDLIRKLEGESGGGRGGAFALTWPLMTTSSGQKFGKSEGNAVWLSADKTSPFEFYQFWLRTEDADVGRYLKFFTFVPIEEIEALLTTHQQAPEKRQAQKRLAEEMTRLVHGQGELDKAISATQTLFGGAGSNAKLDAAAVAALISQGVPTTTLTPDQLANSTIVDLCVLAGLAPSKSEIRRLLAGNGIHLNNQPVSDPNHKIPPSDLIDNHYLVVRKGKKDNRVIKVG